MEALSSCSMFNGRQTRQKILFIDIEWRGLIKTLTREYTGISLRYDSHDLALLDIRAGYACNHLYSDAFKLLLAETHALIELEVCLHYRKCSTQKWSFVYDACSARFVQSPVYIGEGVDKFSIRLSVSKDDEQRFKLTIENQTDVYGTRVMINANLCSVVVDEASKHTINI